MGSKIFLVLGLLVAIVFISSEVAARDLAETSIDHKKSAEKATGRNGVSGASYRNYGYPPPPGGGGYGYRPGGVYGRNGVSGAPYRYYRLPPPPRGGGYYNRGGGVKPHN